ncbi:MAG: glycosyltransferase, partial [Holosporaceae bacterium]|nr:glycosyltransferase [Holosporaceae bacterium]
MKLAPIAMFVYNRPRHVQKAVESLQNNELAETSELFIFADGAKNELDRENVSKVRKYIRTITGFKSIAIFENEFNKGLADSVINGVTKIVNEYGKIIVLEDDLVLSKYFLQYMNNALNMYGNDE